MELSSPNKEYAAMVNKSIFQKKKPSIADINQLTGIAYFAGTLNIAIAITQNKIGKNANNANNINTS